MARICSRCNRSVEPIHIYDRAKKSGRIYLITQCPHERCGFFFDAEDWTGKTVPPANKKRLDSEGKQRSIWRDVSQREEDGGDA